jgi:hypothetical protein
MVSEEFGHHFVDRVLVPIVIDNEACQLDDVGQTPACLVQYILQVLHRHLSLERWIVGDMIELGWNVRM